MEIVRYRTPDTVITDLREHIKLKIDMLPELAQRFNLDGEAITELQQHLQNELDYLDTAPDKSTLREVMGHYFAQSAEFRRKVTGED
ncbi:MAG: hypothetical protein ABID04_02780 [Patescibacteria group bacterium]